MKGIMIKHLLPCALVYAAISIIYTQTSVLNNPLLPESGLPAYIATSRQEEITASSSSTAGYSATLQTRSEHSVAEDQRCPSNHFTFQNKVLPTEITHFDRAIPRVIHLFAHSKCLPHKMKQYMDQWTSLTNHSVILHDKEEMMGYLSLERNDTFRFIPNAMRCALCHEALLDLSRFMVLYDQGGISVDIDHVPGPGFMNGTLLDNVRGVRWQFLVEELAEKSGGEDEEDKSPKPSSPRFMASMPGHEAVYLPTIMATAGLFRQFQNYSFGTYSDERQNIYNGAITPYQGRDRNESITTRNGSKPISNEKRKIGVIHAERISGDLLTQVPISPEIKKESLLFRDFEDMKTCVDLTNDSYKVDVQSLFDAVSYKDSPTDVATCPGNLTHVKNIYRPESFQKEGRKIPKVVHMTSKGRCFTKEYHDNARMWHHDGYSFFLHDDEAVDRLLSRDWPEFPLLHHVRPCLISGAAKADYWRYVALWAYGGIYTDIDNAPGVGLWNGTESIISDEDDAVFEVERSGLFLSQYFYAVSPHHPISYFMASAAIERLVLGQQGLGSKIPYITGPGAVKQATYHYVGNPIPEGNGKTHNGLYNRSITVIGNRIRAKSGFYIRRSILKASKLAAMNMTHYFDFREGSEYAAQMMKVRKKQCYVWAYENAKGMVV